jgi:hypothetical protein
MLARTSRGRVATPAAWAHLGLEMGREFERQAEATLFDGL